MSAAGPAASPPNAAARLYPAPVYMYPAGYNQCYGPAGAASVVPTAPYPYGHHPGQQAAYPPAVPPMMPPMHPPPPQVQNSAYGDIAAQSPQWSPNYLPERQTAPLASKPVIRERCICFTPLMFIVCTIVLVVEFWRNAAGEDFNAAPSPQCEFRVDLADFKFCAASMSLNPMFGPRAEVLLEMGATAGTQIVNDGQAWRLLTGIFLHGGALHWAMNMIALLAIGLPMERVHGALRLGAIYMASGLFGAMASAIFAPHLLSVGASGAIFGLIGAAIGDVLLNWDMQVSPCCALVKLTLFTALNLLIGTVPMVDNFAHAFGFLMGIASSLLFLTRLNKRPYCLATCSRRFIRLLAFGFVSAALAAGTFLLFLDSGGSQAREYCPDCQKISCAAFPWGCEEEDSSSKCWWTCETMQAPMHCTGKATFGETRKESTVDLGCPLRRGGSKEMRLFPVDLRRWDEAKLNELCQEHCADL